MPKIEIYTKDYCPYCALAKSILQAYGARYAEHSLSENPTLFDTMVKRSDGRRTVPQIFFDGIGIGGADELSILDESGQRGEPECPGAMTTRKWRTALLDGAVVQGWFVDVDDGKFIGAGGALYLFCHLQHASMAIVQRVEGAR